MQKKHTKTAGANSNLLKRVDQRDDVVALEADVTLKAGVTIWVGAHECGMRNATHFVGEQHAQRDADAGDLQLRLAGCLPTGKRLRARARAHLHAAGLAGDAVENGTDVAELFPDGVTKNFSFRCDKHGPLIESLKRFAALGFVSQRKQLQHGRSRAGTLFHIARHVIKICQHGGSLICKYEVVPADMREQCGAAPCSRRAAGTGRRSRGS